MGAYVSMPECQSHYNITVNCDYKVNATELNGTAPTIGGYGRREIPTDPDVAGIGVVSSFIATTSLALILSIISVLWMIGKRTWGNPDENKHRKKHKRQCHVSLSELCEALVLSCSDTQIFTGGAYALTLRYFKGCSITAYHYDIVANLMLLTCATHLMSITIVRNYWRWPWLGILRTLICTGVFIVTGILLANQNSSTDFPFPSTTPSLTTTDDPILMPAACFQQGNSQLPETLTHSLNPTFAADAFFRSTPGNRIPGWNSYLIILLLYVVAAFVDVLRSFRRGALSNPTGKRGRIVGWLKTCGRRSKPKDPNAKSPFFSIGSIVFLFFCLYLLGGVGVSCWTVFQSATYIFKLRTWAKYSGWLKMESGNQSAEDDATSFGQLVPIFLNVMLLFTIAQLLSQACWKYTDRKFDIYGGVIHEKDDDDSITMADRPPSASKPNASVQVHQYSAVPSDFHSASADIQPIVVSAPAPAPVPAPAPAGRWDSGRWDAGLTQPAAGPLPPQNRWQNSPTPPSIPEETLRSTSQLSQYQNNTAPSITEQALRSTSQQSQYQQNAAPSIPEQALRSTSQQSQYLQHTEPSIPEEALRSTSQQSQYQQNAAPNVQEQTARSVSYQPQYHQSTGSWSSTQQPATYTSYSQPHRVASFPSYADAPAPQQSTSEYHARSNHSLNSTSNIGRAVTFPAGGQQPPPVIGPDGRQWQYIPTNQQQR